MAASNDGLIDKQSDTPKMVFKDKFTHYGFLWWSTYAFEVVICTHTARQLLNNFMNKSALQDIQQALNVIRSELERVDDETKWTTLELMLSTSSSVVALAKKDDQTKNKDCHSYSFYS